MPTSQRACSRSGLPQVGARPRSALSKLALLTAVGLVCIFNKSSRDDAFSSPQSGLYQKTSVGQVALQAAGRPGAAWNHKPRQQVPDESSHSSKFAKTSLRSSSAPAVVALFTTIGMVRKATTWAVGVTAGLVALLYATRFFELLLESSTSLLNGQSLFVAGVTGLLVGALHTLAGPDHFAGLAPLVIGQRRSPLGAFGLGALWGSGHATGQLLLGLGCLAVQFGFFGAAPPFLSQMSGGLVGASLIAIGLLGLYEARQFDPSEVGTREEDGSGASKERFGWTTYATGVLHGLSPDAIVFLAPAFALTRPAAILHVTGVVVGTLLTMGACTALLSMLSHRLPNFRRVSGAASGVAMALGVCILAASLGFSVPLPGL